MLNMREKSEMQAALSAQMRGLETPSRSVESELETLLNTSSPGRSSSWILPHEIMTAPDRPTAGGPHTPSGNPVQYAPSPVTQEYCRPSPRSLPPAHWEITMLDNQEKKNVNCSEIYLQAIMQLHGN